MSNKKAGNDFEQEFCQMLSNYDFWAYNTVNKKSGQPADIIAARNGQAYLIDCKDCANDVFILSRIEQNQHYAMRKWELCGNNQGIFALRMSDGVYMIRYGTLEVLQMAKIKQLKASDVLDHGGMKFEDWRENNEID